MLRSKRYAVDRRHSTGDGSVLVPPTQFNLHDVSDLPFTASCRTRPRPHRLFDKTAPIVTRNPAAEVGTGCVAGMGTCGILDFRLSR